MEQKKTLKRVLASSLAVLLVGAGAGITAKMIKDSRQINPDIKIELPDAGGAVIDTEIGNSPSMRLTATRLMSSEYESNGVSAQAESAYTLTATITPADAGLKKLDWAVMFKNASSTWATEKTVTDYVTVTPTSDGALTAVVENKAAFGEQILVKATSRDNTSATATCTVDYEQKVTGYTLTLDGTSYNSESTNEIVVTPNFATTRNTTVTATVNKSAVYTKSNHSEVISIDVRPALNFKNAIGNVGVDSTKLKTYSGTANGSFTNFFDKEWNKALSDMNALDWNNVIYAIDHHGTNAYELYLNSSVDSSVSGKFFITLDSSVVVKQKMITSFTINETQIVF